MSSKNLEISELVIVGGGTAGWLTAAVLAADQRHNSSRRVKITVLESPDIPTIGVGEGTWPSMMGTLQSIGISEKTFIQYCHVSLKQGSRFYGWSKEGQEYYDHPFSEPMEYKRVNLAEHWLCSDQREPFAYVASPQPSVCDLKLAPKQIQTPEYAFNLNYGYHLDAGAFSEMLRKHCVNVLGVTHRADEMVGINPKPNDDIESLVLKSGNKITADLFIDCTGLSSLLLGKHYQAPWISYKRFLFNDTALAVQVPYTNDQQPIASQTLSTAFEGGWIWDIGLSTRRGIGAVYASDYIDETSARAALSEYLKATGAPVTLRDSDPRKIQFDPGRREYFWKNNCVAIGLSSGFVEPLEATALVLVEQSARYLKEQMPTTRREMDIVASRFNERFVSHWENVVDFLKLHYVLSQRNDSAYWLDHRSEKSIPERLKESLVLWKARSPWLCDSYLPDELFSAASYQYVLYGMRPDWTDTLALERRVKPTVDKAKAILKKKNQTLEQLFRGLPSNRQFLSQ